MSIDHLMLYNKQNQFVGKIPYLKMLINSKQSIAAFGLDFSKPDTMPDLDNFYKGVSPTTMGKLEEQKEKTLKDEFLNVLKAEKWDFETYPNPELVLLTKK